MSKIFLTGMSAPQASKSSNIRSMGFAGVVHKVLTDAGHEVVWETPSVTMTKEYLNTFDSVIVGVCPITSVSANRVYGALNVIHKMKDSQKLTLFVDTPALSQIEITLRSVLNKPESLTKSFFSYRKEYDLVNSDLKLQSRLLETIDFLLNKDWSKTIYPKLPWKYVDNLRLPKNAKTNLYGISLDAHLIRGGTLENDRANKWVVDSQSSPWFKSTVPHLTLPNSPMKWNKGWTDEQVFEQISRSIGAIICPDKKDGTSWSYRYIQAMNSNTPIVTDWLESQRTGSAWSLLASSIEEMTQPKRDLIALAQKESYLANIPTKEASLNQLEQILGIGK